MTYFCCLSGHRVSSLHQVSCLSVLRLVRYVRELNRNENNSSEIGSFQFSTFPGHIIYPFFNQRYLFEHMYAFKKSRTPQTESDHQDFLKYTIMLGTSIHSTTVLCDTYIPIHDVLAEAVCYFPRNTVFTELSLSLEPRN